MKQSVSTSIRVVKISTCLTLSAKSHLTYHVGADAEDALCFRVMGNDGGGFFSNEWVSLNTILEAIGKCIKPITSSALTRIFQAKSANTAGFLLAAIKDVGIVKPVEGKQRGYERCDPEVFLAEIGKLVSSGVDLQVEEPVVAKQSPAPKGKKSKAADSQEASQ